MTKMSDKYRSAVRFVCVGVLGTLLQYGIYYLFLDIFRESNADSQTMTSVAFSIGFLVEMVVNYLLTNYYTFHTHPSWKNAGGFLVGRAINYGVQILFLNILIWLSMSEEIAGIVAIILAGIINYFMLVPLFRTKEDKE